MQCNPGIDLCLIHGLVAMAVVCVKRESERERERDTVLPPLSLNLRTDFLPSKLLSAYRIQQLSLSF